MHFSTKNHFIRSFSSRSAFKKLELLRSSYFDRAWSWARTTPWIRLLLDEKKRLKVHFRGKIQPSHITQRAHTTCVPPAKNDTAQNGLDFAPSFSAHRAFKELCGIGDWKGMFLLETHTEKERGKALWDVRARAFSGPSQNKFLDFLRIKPTSAGISTVGVKVKMMPTKHSWKFALKLSEDEEIRRNVAGRSASEVDALLPSRKG